MRLYLCDLTYTAPIKHYRAYLGPDWGYKGIQFFVKSCEIRERKKVRN